MSGRGSHSINCGAKIQVPVTLYQEHIESLDAIARDRQTNRSSIIREAVEAYLQRQVGGGS